MILSSHATLNSHSIHEQSKGGQNYACGSATEKTPSGLTFRFMLFILTNRFPIGATRQSLAGVRSGEKLDATRSANIDIYLSPTV
jgi:hypothetical protein